ncbi:E4 ORF4 [Bat mastadenovirus WIV11]|uniref:E4 ORF4 n=1 Tax=Bat mastadenovirus WIV11 TaxID=1788433 RepID=A0A163HLH0_9ADEN|nr:E4 ORF4 [Bat mastadenovirus WIV11]AMB43139.1 E4 ORF4 [Bat mastadenovirus WIV11]
MAPSRLTLFGRCKPKYSSEFMLKMVKDATLCLQGFHQDDFGMDYSVQLDFKNTVLSPGFFSCDLLVEAGAEFNISDYAEKLTTWLTHQLHCEPGFETVTVVPQDPVEEEGAAACSSSSTHPPPKMSNFKLGKCISLVSHIYEHQDFSEELKHDIQLLTRAFFESESKGGYEKIFACAVENPQKCGPLQYGLFVFVASESLGGGDEACGQRLWALCQRLEEWLNVQLFAKYPEYERSVCVPQRNELKPSVL